MARSFISLRSLLYRSDSARLHVEDAETADVVRGKVALIAANLDDVNRYWDEQTGGLRLAPDGAIYTRDGTLFSSPPAGGVAPTGGATDEKKRRRRSDRHSKQVRHN